MRVPQPGDRLRRTVALSAVRSEVTDFAQPEERGSVERSGRSCSDCGLVANVHPSID